MKNPTFGTFRGWGIKDNKWVYGWRADNCIIPSTKHAYDYTTNERFVEVTDCIEVHPESLAMFTGLYDTNDKPIYGSIPLPDATMSKGGDIVVIEGERERCFFEFREYGFHLCSVKTKTYYYYNSSLDELKIIGNAYENPDVLEWWNE